DPMARAVALGEHGRRSASPNPWVGCVVVDDHGTMVGEGWHRRPGTPHAEAEALAAAGERARGATAYVTLEPCAHYGPPPRGAPLPPALRRRAPGPPARRPAGAGAGGSPPPRAPRDGVSPAGPRRVGASSWAGARRTPAGRSRRTSTTGAPAGRSPS